MFLRAWSSTQKKISRSSSASLLCFFFLREGRGETFHYNEKVITPRPKDHNTELSVLTVREPLGKPRHMRHLAKYSPLLLALYKKWLFSLPYCPRCRISSSFTRKKRKKNTEETGNKQLCRREGKFIFLFMKWDDESKTTTSSPLYALWLWQAFKAIDNIDHISHIQIHWSITAHTSLKGKMS